VEHRVYRLLLMGKQCAIKEADCTFFRLLLVLQFVFVQSFNKDTFNLEVFYEKENWNIVIAQRTGGRRGSS
jgi:hypothetical protein